MKGLKNMTKKQKIAMSIIATVIVVAIVITSVILVSKKNHQETDTNVVDNIDGDNREEGKSKETRNKKAEEAHIQLEPVANTPYGMGTKSELKLTTTTPMKEDDIKRNLKFSPQKDYVVEKVNDKEFILAVDTPFENNQIVKVTYKTEKEKLGWAFQTVKKFGIASTHPGNKAYNVPIDSGIELHFTKDVENKKIDEYFDIQPSTQGKFTFRKNTVIFVPEIALEKGMDYVVTIKKGFSNGTEVLEEDYSFTFHTDSYGYRSECIYLYGTTENMTYFKSDKPQILSCYTGGNDNSSVELNIYKFNNKEDYIKGYRSHNDIKLEEYISTIPSSEKYTYTVKSQRYEHNEYLELQDLDEGYYFLTAKYQRSVDSMFIQVSPYNAYTAVDKDKFMVWMVNGNNGQVVKDAKVIINDETLGRTDEDGFAFIDKKQEHYEGVAMELQVDSSNPLILPLDIKDYYEDGNRLYWSYIYFDRGLYLPTDEINIFGFVQKRNGEDVKSIKVQLYNDNNLLMEEKEVNLTDIGTYQTLFKIDNYLNSYVRIHVLVDDKIIENRYLNIAKFQKPTYKVTASFDKDVIMMGDSVTLSADVNFYEGTPAAYSNIQLRSYSFQMFGRNTEDKVDYQCDEMGHKEVTLTPYSNTTGWKPMHFNVLTHFIDLEKRYITDNSSMIIFPRDTMVETTEQKISETEVQMTINVSEIDISNFKGKMYDYDSYRGNGIPSKNVDIEIVERYYEKIYEGKGYDFINKISYDKYRYKKHEKTVATKRGTTDENGQFTFNFDEVKENRGYEFIVYCMDGNQRGIDYRAYYSEASYNNREEKYLDRYSLNMKQYKYKYKKNESMKISVLQGNEEIPPRDNDRALFFICKDGIIDYVITDQTSIDLTYLKKYIPNAEIQAVYFDGQSLHKDYNMRQYFRYNYEDEELTLNIETDKKDYRPGDTVKAAVRVTDKNNQPVVTDVNMSVVDEAFFAICEDNTNVLSNLYRHAFSSGILGECLAAYNIYYGGNGAECGGEGDAGFIRNKFKNTADFTTVRTDENGIAYREFELPDNLTSWRITCTAMDNELKAGKEKYNVNAKLPFFISSIVYNDYMDGDDIQATIKTAGAQLSKDDQVEFTGIIEREDGTVIEVKETGKGHDYVNIPIGKLPKGKHKLTIMAKMGTFKDGEQYDIEITDTLHYFDVVKQEDLTEDMDIISNDQYVHLDFFSKEICDHYYGLYKIYSSGYTRRSDYKIASYMAGKELNNKYKETYELHEDGFREYFSYKGLYTDFTYGHESAEITASIISIGYTEEKEKLVNGLLQAARNKDLTVVNNIAALWGLTMLGEPVLLDATAFYNDYKDAYEALSFEKMYMMLTFIDSGDLEKGKTLYNEVKKNHMKKKHEWLYLEDNEAGVKLTAMMMVAALKLDLVDDAKGMYAYLTSVSSRYYPTITEKLYYLQHTKPKNDTATFQYELDGRKETVSLGELEYYSLDLTPEQASNIKFSNIKGNVRVIKDFIGTVKDVEKTDKYSVKRWYTSENSSSTITQGEVVNVHIKVEVFDARLKSFVLEDILPTGLAYLGQGKTNIPRQASVWLHNEERQTKISAHIYKMSKNLDSYSFEITYKARAVLAGEYVAEPVIIRDYVHNDISHSDEGSVMIK